MMRPQIPIGSPWRVFLRPVLATAAVFQLALMAASLLGNTSLSTDQMIWFWVAGIPQSVAIALVFSVLPGGAALARAGFGLRTTLRIALTTGAIVLVVDAVVDPYFSFLVEGFAFGPHVRPPETPWRLLRRAADMRVSLSSPGIPGSTSETAARLIVLNALAPLLRFVLALLNVSCGYLAGRVVTRVSLARLSWVLLLMIDGAFYKGLYLTFQAVRLGAATLWVACLLPLAAGVTILAVLLLAQPPGPDIWRQD